MAGTIVSQLTNVTTAEAADSTLWDDIGGGPGSAQSDELPIQGTEARARRIDGAIRGFSFDNTATIDISASGTHVGWWVNVLQVSLINTDGIELLLGDASTPKTGNWSGYFYDETAYPLQGGWIRVWVDPTRTADTGAGTLNLSTVRQFGVEFDMGNVGGNAPNCYVDRIDYTTGGLLINAGTGGAPATFQDFADADENSTNAYGVVRPQNGVNFILARITIGNATATIFTDSGFANIFADQRLCASDFMGLTIDLQNASTAVTLSNGLVRSGGTVNLGDFIVSGTSGTLSCASLTLDTLRLLTFTSASTFTGCRVANSGQITFNGATFTGGAVVNSTAATALLWNTTDDTDGKLDDTEFISAGTGHAIEFTSAPSTITLSGVTFTSYAATDGSTGNEAIYNNTGGALTINVVDGGNTPSIRNGTGASTTVNNPQTLTITRIQPDSEVRIYNAADTTIEYAGSESVSGELIAFDFVNAGSGYVVSDVLTLSGGTFTTAAQITVSSVDGGGAITGATITTAGSYTAAPSEPITLTGGTGSNATINADILASFSYSYNYTADIPIIIVIASLDYNILRLVGQSLINGNQTVPVQQIGDRVYLNP